jgi:hypothetical protein
MCMRSCHPAAATGDGSGGSAAVGLAIASAAQKRGMNRERLTLD